MTRIVQLTVLVREDDEQDLVDGLIQFVEYDPWSFGARVERRDPTDADRDEFAETLAEREAS
jgi:hypothetical protein